MLSEPLPTPRAIRIGMVLFSVTVFVISWWHWWTFQYGTFDLAFYQQALWQAIHGKWWVSLLNVPLMGNHAEPIVFLLTPVFALWPHPMLFVIVQTLALATLAPTGYRIASRLGFDRAASIALGLALLFLPATSSVGIYEFHPETLVAPLLLLLIEARLAQRYGAFCLWFLAVLACKENLALLLVAFCAVFAVVERSRGRSWQMRWNLGPLLVAAGWLVICGKVISPWLNAGNVDYGELYSHLGRGGGEIVQNFFVEPHRALGALKTSLTQGDLLWSLLFPLLLLPLLRLRWLVIATPLLLQHLLSWRFTEWSLGAHYPAPFIPLFWIAAVEGLARLKVSRTAAFAVLGACVLANFRFGEAPRLAKELPYLADKLEEREWKAEMIARIPPTASVTAGQPYLSHLASREQLYSLHHVLKGLKTLSRESYAPPTTEAVVIDYADGNTFSPKAGFYHPLMRTEGEHLVPSSDRLLHEFLRGHRWEVRARNDLAVYTQGEPVAPIEANAAPLQFDEQTTLLNLQMPLAEPAAMRVRFAWEFGPSRQLFPWMTLVLTDGKRLYPLTKGACAPEGGPGKAYEDWLAIFPASIPAGEYVFYAVFYDGVNAAWKDRIPPADLTYVLKQIELGRYRIGRPEAGKPAP